MCYTYEQSKSCTRLHLYRTGTRLFGRLICLDLKCNSITVKELLDNDAAKAVIGRIAPELLNHPMLGMAKGMSLEKVISMVGSLLSPEKINTLLEELKKA